MNSKFIKFYYSLYICFKTKAKAKAKAKQKEQIMRQYPGGIKSIPFAEYDAVAKPMLRPVVLAEGTTSGLTILLPALGDVCVTQSTGVIADSGALAGKIQQSANGSDWEDLATFLAAGATAYEKKIITPTKLYLKWVGVVTGGGAGTVATAASIIY